MRLAIGCLLLALPALAQLDSAALRAEFGAPLLHRETFHMPQGFDLQVVYGARDQVCRMEMPAWTSSLAETDRFLQELVPDSMRGKKGLSRSGSGENGRTVDIYEHVTIAVPNIVGPASTIIVEFRNEACKP